MVRTILRLSALVVGFAACQGLVAAQYASMSSTGNFAGTWVLVDAKPARPGYDQFWMGTEVAITQTSETLEISRIAPAPLRTAKLVFGKETQNAYAVNGQKVLRHSRSTLRDGLLLISTDTTTDAEPRRRTNIMRWSVESDGLLSITDTEMCGKGECPSIITNLRFKKK